MPPYRRAFFYIEEKKCDRKKKKVTDVQDVVNTNTFK